jgi:Zn-dependent protease
VLYALAHPFSLAVLLTSFLVGVTLHGWVQALAADRVGDRRPRAERRTEPDPRRHIDPFGAVAAGLAGLGWARPVQVLDRRRRGAVLAVALSGPAVNLVLGVGLLLAWRFAYGPAPLGANGLAYDLQHGIAAAPADYGSVALALAGASQLYLGALSLVPLPPLDGGRLLFAFAPRSQGWQRAEHYLVEQNIGIFVVLALLLFPLGGNVPPIPALLDIILGPVISRLTGG